MTTPTHPARERTAGVVRLAEVLLTEHIDGDFLVGCGRSIGNEGGDVGLNVARASEVAYWAEAAAIEWLAARLTDPDVLLAVTEAVWSAPRNGTSWDVAQTRSTAAVSAIRAALTDPAPDRASVAGGGV